MIAHERQKAILEALETQPTLSVQVLISSFNASPATIRRDLDFLEKKGQLIRIHGGVIHPDSLAGEPTFHQRLRENPSGKISIAEKAASMVPPGGTVFVDAGTTCLEAGRILLAREDVTVFTNSCPLVNIPNRRQARLVCIGGELREISRAMVGALALDWLSKLTFHTAFIGASGLSAEGASTTELSEAEIKRQVLSRAKERILLADSSKWEVPSTFLYSGWDLFDTWITDSPKMNSVFARSTQSQTKIIVA